MFFETNLPKVNSYLKVTAEFEVYGLNGNRPSNTWIGQSRVLDPVYEKLTLQPGDEIHHLIGGTFAIHGGQVWMVILKPDAKSILEKRYSADQHKWPLEKLQKISSVEKTRIVAYRGIPLDRPVTIENLTKE